MNYEGAKDLELGGDNIKVDPSVAEVLPEGCRVVSTEGHGVSFWASTGRIHVVLIDGTEESFFMKVISKDIGKKMMQAEFESMKAIHSVVPKFVPKPIAWGKYQTIPDTHFFLCEYREMNGEIPEPQKFTARLAELHQHSESPTGEFGFHVATFGGNKPQIGGWEKSWEKYFAKAMRHTLNMEIEAKGHDPAFDELVPILFDEVIPRLLRPLESDGHFVKPSLVHGDLWFANSGVDENSGDPIVFDACCFYAHNEYEFGQWRPICNRFGAEYLSAYQSYVQISPPEEDYYGRLDLYRLKFDTHVSALFTENQTLRHQVIDGLRDMAGRYGSSKVKGSDAPKPRADLNITPAPVTLMEAQN